MALNSPLKLCKAEQSCRFGRSLLHEWPHSHRRFIIVIIKILNIAALNFVLVKLWTGGAPYHRGQRSMKPDTAALQELTAKKMSRFVMLCALARLQRLTPSQHPPLPLGHDRKHAAQVWRGRHLRSSGKPALRTWGGLTSQKVPGTGRSKVTWQAGQARWISWLHLDYGASPSARRVHRVSHPL